MKKKQTNIQTNENGVGRRYEHLNSCSYLGTVVIIDGAGSTKSATVAYIAIVVRDRVVTKPRQVADIINRL